MRIKISKLDAAILQLKQTIRLFFDEADPVSIHTLTCAANEILNDYLQSKGLPTLLHKNSAAINPEYQKEWALKLTEARNFFKHAERHIAQGLEEIDFNTETNPYLILDSICALERLGEAERLKDGEFLIFFVWFSLKYPKSINAAYVERAATLKMNPENLAEFSQLLKDFQAILPALLKAGFWASS